MDAQRSLSPRQREAAEEAGRWFARLMGADAQDPVRDAWRLWFARCPENQWAWSRVEAVQRCFTDVPAEIGTPTFQRLSAQRRRVLRLALMGASAVPLGMLLSEVPAEWRAWNAAYKTAVGQIAPVPLGNGVLAVLDTDSAADVVTSGGEDRIVLRNGRIYVRNEAPDASAVSTRRTLVVQTEHGSVYAMGAEFTVGIHGDHSMVRVNRAAVRVAPCTAGAAEEVVQAGYCADFSTRKVGPVQNRPSKVFAAWHTGSMMAVNLPLAEFVKKLRAYRPGLLFLDDALAALQVSGTFPLSRTDLALDALENSYPVRIRRLTRYMTWIEAREA